MILSYWFYAKSFGVPSGASEVSEVSEAKEASEPYQEASKSSVMSMSFLVCILVNFLLFFLLWFLFLFHFLYLVFHFLCNLRKFCERLQSLVQEFFNSPSTRLLKRWNAASKSGTSSIMLSSHLHSWSSLKAPFSSTQRITTKVCEFNVKSFNFTSQFRCLTSPDFGSILISRKSLKFR